MPPTSSALPGRPPRHRASVTAAVIIVSAILGSLAGRWLVSDPGPGDRHTVTKDIPLLAGSGLQTPGSRG